MKSPDGARRICARLAGSMNGKPPRGFQRGRPRHPKAGRRKGTPNAVPAALKDMILQALANVGGIDYLEQQAKANPSIFLSLIGRVLPLQVKTDGTDPTVPTVVNHIYEPR